MPAANSNDLELVRGFDLLLQSLEVVGDENLPQRLLKSISSVRKEKGVSRNMEELSSGCFSLQFLL